MPVESVPSVVDPPKAEDQEAPKTQPAAQLAKSTRSWVGRVLRPLNAGSSSRQGESDPLAAFASETEARSAPANAKSAPSRVKSQTPAVAPPRRVGVALVLPLVLAILLAAAATFGLTRAGWLRLSAAPQSGTVTLVTRPAGAQVTINGAPRGVTPITVSLLPGAHTIGVRLGRQERVIPVTVAAGADIVRDLEMTAGQQADL